MSNKNCWNIFTYITPILGAGVDSGDLLGLFVAWIDALPYLLYIVTVMQVLLTLGLMFVPLLRWSAPVQLASPVATNINRV